MPLWDDRPEAWHEILPGVRRRILAASPEVMMVLYRIASNTVFPLHRHPHVQAGTFLAGGGSFRVGEATWPMREGSSYLVPADVPHELRTHSEGESVILDVFAPERSDFRNELLEPDRP